ncbi:MAG: DUF72 domain-containing protein [Gammaproteobacteria bacterium]|nr:DUF72 domain-containing protein [Gammaproteobacteria bacterium]
MSRAENAAGEMGETISRGRATATSPLPYRLGLPAWNFPAWQGRYFAYRPRALRSYARVFNAVEGNTTFYRTPGARTVAAWREAVQGTDFRFSFKLPREITHTSRVPGEALQGFLRAIEPLEDHLGPLLVQFPPWKDPHRLHELEQLFARLPRNHRYVVEVRHPDFFSQPALLEPLLEKYALGRVVMDARALSRGGRSHPEVLAARHEKPDLPVLPRVYNNLVFLRLVLHPARQHNRPYIDEWSARVADYIVRGCAVHVMAHCPNNLHCPELALEFHRALLTRRGMCGVPALEPWPVPRQGQLF